jgi:RNA polymerase sigma-70 factor (subfamily 1)
MQSQRIDGAPNNLEAFRNYLAFLARKRLRNELHSKVDPDAVVNQVLFEAMRQNLSADAEHALAFLERNLKHRLIDEIRKFQAAGRDVSLERSIDESFQQSSACLIKVLAADHTSPSERACRNELLLRLSDALAQLPPRQREAVECKHLDGMTLEQTAERLAVSKTAAAGLIYRGLRQLREILDHH